MCRYLYFYISALFLIITTSLSAQPDWEVIPSDFQYTMTTVGVAIFDCVESTDENDIIAAFIDDEVRGMQNLATEVEGRKYAFMIIYDNDFSGNEVTFKIYDASEDTIINALYANEFMENGNIGNVDIPTVFSSDYPLDKILLTRDSLSEEDLAGTVVTGLFLLNENGDTISATFEFINDSLGVDNNYFSISDSSLVLENDVNIDVKDFYQIHLKAITENGCMIDSVYILTVSDQNPLSTFDPLENSINKISFFPNPAKDIVFIKSEIEIEKISIYDLSGKLINSYNGISNLHSINVSNLNNQLYTIVFQNKEFISSDKLLIHR